MTSNEEYKKTVLWIQSSIKEPSVSYSSRIGKSIIQTCFSDAKLIIKRDCNTIPHISLDEITLAYNQTSQNDNDNDNDNKCLSELCIDEVKHADAIVISCPMYNFNIPSSLKAWIDHIVIRGKTFKYGETGPIGLCNPNTPIYVAISSGGNYSDNSPMDHITNYLKFMFAFIGFKNIQVFWVGGSSLMNPEDYENQINKVIECLQTQ